MNRKRLYIALGIIICLVIGFFAGQEYTKYQLRKAITDAFSNFGNTFNNEIVDNEDNTPNEDTKDKNTKHDKKSNKGDQTIKDKETKNKKSVKDTSITISKGVPKSISSKYNSDDIEAEITLNDVSFIDEIRPPEPTQNYYHYYGKKDGKTYAVVSLKLKNTGGTSFNISDILRNAYSFDSNTCSAKAIFGGKYSYTADIIAKLEKDSKGGHSYESTFIYIDPLETMDIIIAYSVPNEVKDKNAELNICLGNQKINLDFSTTEPIKQDVENSDENSDENSGENT